MSWAQTSQQPSEDWRGQVRRLSAAQDWPGALVLLDAEIARSPHDLDIKAWRARVLTWAGRLDEAERAYREILSAEGPGRYDPDHWAGLATVYLRESKTDDALRAMESAVQLDSKRADLHTEYARILRAAGRHAQAEIEFKKALSLDPQGVEARTAVRAGRTASFELRGGTETDLLNYAVPNEGQWANFISRWAPHFSTNLGFGTYQRSGIFAGKFVGSVTVRGDAAGAFTVGGEVADDNGVIPRSEAFFDFDKGHKNREAKFLRGFEFEYGQHWYWYAAARILTLNGAATVYLPRDWFFTVGATGARSAFSGTGSEWRPSGVARLGFPLHSWHEAHLGGNVFFAAGTENFGLVDQIGKFASQTYGGGLRWEWSSRQFVNYTYSYQRRTQGRTDSYDGITYGIRF